VSSRKPNVYREKLHALPLRTGVSGAQSQQTRYAQFGITGLMPSAQLCRMLVGEPAAVLVSALAVEMRSA
jgi:hypothetical protein